jgi:hypothetical protein
MDEPEAEKRCLTGIPYPVTRALRRAVDRCPRSPDGSPYENKNPRLAVTVIAMVPTIPMIAMFFMPAAPLALVLALAGRALL